jgi:hypothetical protein
MRWKLKMTPSTLNTILNSAPMVVQGASKLINLIKEQSNNKPVEEGETQLTVENLKTDIDRLEVRLAATDESNIEQIKLIEQLARQNEVMAESVGKSINSLNYLIAISILLGVVATSAFIFILFR